MNVESFTLDHTKVHAPYIRLCNTTVGEKGDKIYKYDIRFAQPNKDYMEIKAQHSLEHLLAVFLRNHLKNVLDLSPMGCQTGFYLIMLNNNSIEDISNGLEQSLFDILNATEVPASNEQQCGYALSHDLDEAKKWAKKILNNKKQWLVEFFSHTLE